MAVSGEIKLRVQAFGYLQNSPKNIKHNPLLIKFSTWKCKQCALSFKDRSHNTSAGAWLLGWGTHYDFVRLQGATGRRTATDASANPSHVIEDAEELQQMHRPILHMSSLIYCSWIRTSHNKKYNYLPLEDFFGIVTRLPKEAELQ